MDELQQQLMVDIGNSKMFRIIAEEIICAALKDDNVSLESMKCIMKTALPKIVNLVFTQDISDNLVLFERRKTMDMIEKTKGMCIMMADKIQNFKEEENREKLVNASVLE